MNADPGMVPDIRYLSPAYLTAGLLGVYMLYLNAFPARAEKTLSRLVLFSAAGIPLILIGIVAFPPFGGLYTGYSRFFTLVITLVTLLVTAGLLISSFGKQHPVLLACCFILLVVIVLSWQMMMVILYSAVKVNGYAFWVPLTDTFFHQVIAVHQVPPV
jgi:hypothetical protein